MMVARTLRSILIVAAFAAPILTGCTAQTEATDDNSAGSTNEAYCGLPEVTVTCDFGNGTTETYAQRASHVYAGDLYGTTTFPSDPIIDTFRTKVVNLPHTGNYTRYWHFTGTQSRYMAIDTTGNNWSDIFNVVTSATSTWGYWNGSQWVAWQSQPPVVAAHCTVTPLWADYSSTCGHPYVPTDIVAYDPCPGGCW